MISYIISQNFFDKINLFLKLKKPNLFLSDINVK